MTSLKVELGRVSCRELQHTDNTHQQNDDFKFLSQTGNKMVIHLL